MKCEVCGFEGCDCPPREWRERRDRLIGAWVPMSMIVGEIGQAASRADERTFVVKLLELTRALEAAAKAKA